jgi:hypothetical protein
LMALVFRRCSFCPGQRLLLSREPRSTVRAARVVFFPLYFSSTLLSQVFAFVPSEVRSGVSRCPVVASDGPL